MLAPEPGEVLHQQVAHLLRGQQVHSGHRRPRREEDARGGGEEGAGRSGGERRGGFVEDGEGVRLLAEGQVGEVDGHEGVVVRADVVLQCGPAQAGHGGVGGGEPRFVDAEELGGGRFVVLGGSRRERRERGGVQRVQRVGRVRQGHDAVRELEVRHGGRHGSVGAVRARQARARVARHPSVRGFQAIYPAKRRGGPDRPPAVDAVRDGHQACGHGVRGPAGRSARVIIPVVRVQRGGGGRVVVGGVDAHLVHVRLSDDERARVVFEFGGAPRAAIQGVPEVGDAADPSGVVGHVDLVFHPDGDAVERGEGSAGPVPFRRGRGAGEDPFAVDVHPCGAVGGGVGDEGEERFGHGGGGQCAGSVGLMVRGGGHVAGRGGTDVRFRDSLNGVGQE